MPKTAAIILTQLDDGSFSVLDANGTVHEVSSEQELAQLCLQIVNDPTLPTYATKQAAVDDAEDMMTKVAEAMLPDRFGFLAAPGVGALKKAVTRLRTATATPPVRKISSTPEAVREGQERARQRREEKERLKEKARLAMEERERRKPRLPSVRQ